MGNQLIAPSILSADFSDLKSDIFMVNHSEADWFHIDIMDGVFVPNISYGIPVIKAIKEHASKPLDVHLMIEQPDRYIEEFHNAGADILTVHIEACTHLHRTIQNIKNKGMKAGVAVNPHTTINCLAEVLNYIDLVCIMSVNPGFGGQSFIENTYSKIKYLKSLKNKKNSDFLIEVDGGVTTDNATKIINTGADVLVAGSTVFKSKKPTETILHLKKLTHIL